MGTCPDCRSELTPPAEINEAGALPPNYCRTCDREIAAEEVVITLQTQYTPGPWSINDWPQSTTDIAIGAAGTPWIAKVPLRDVSINEQKANARLIAKAPEMRAEIEALLALVDRVSQDMNWGASALRAETIQALNERPGHARALLALIAGGGHLPVDFSKP